MKETKNNGFQFQENQTHQGEKSQVQQEKPQGEYEAPPGKHENPEITYRTEARLEKEQQ
jgi:hypothetical protein